MRHVCTGGSTGARRTSPPDPVQLMHSGALKGQLAARRCAGSPLTPERLQSATLNGWPSMGGRLEPFATPREPWDWDWVSTAKPAQSLPNGLQNGRFTPVLARIGRFGRHLESWQIRRCYTQRSPVLPAQRGVPPPHSRITGVALSLRCLSIARGSNSPALGDRIRPQGSRNGLIALQGHTATNGRRFQCASREHAIPRRLNGGRSTRNRRSNRVDPERA